ncbi:hypothetical protein SBA2_20002 [Acidobacteriia bacterium SbA2]|nr:hypothetical protein SBA2_20002 [Acidobacteriia bacterium SbA2]
MSRFAIDAPASYGTNTLSSLRISAGQQIAKRPAPCLYGLPASHCSGQDQEAPRSKNERQTTSIAA